MSSVDFLNKLLDGVVVESKALANICKIETGKLNANAAVDDGEFMFFTTAKEISRINKYRWDTEALLIAGNANVGEVKHYSGKFEAYQRTYVLTNFASGMNIRFLFYVLSNDLKKYLEERTNSAAMTYIVLSTLEDFQIPVPCPDNPKKSIEIQAEIVRILDTFTELTNELTNELTTRKKQYKHYRDQLLSFEDVEVEWKTVGEVFDLKNGYTPSKANADYWSNGEVPWFRMEDIRTNGRILRSAIQKVSASAVKGKLIPPNSLIMSTTATLGEHALIEVPFLTNQQITSFTLSKDYDKKVNVKFMFYYFFIFGKWCFENANKNGGMGIIGLSKLKEFKVPVPSLAEQARIVAILDKFDALTSSLTEGLPREIELRQKQYAHYRDLLLSFPKTQEVVA